MADLHSTQPILRTLMSWLALEDMARFEDARGNAGALLQRRLDDVLEAGYDGVQFDVVFTSDQLAHCRQRGLGIAATGRVNHPEEAGPLAERLADAGFPCATLHVGWGMESPDEAARLIEAVLTASDRHPIPLFIETHRATIFQDAWRTVDFLARYPQVRINGDFSHWYTGLEFVYGGFENKLRFIEPVLERVRFLHGRIGNPGCMQVDIGDGDETAHPYVTHFRMLWTRAMEQFLRQSEPGGSLFFVPELLSPKIYYGRTFPDENGVLREECDRWAQSLVLRGLAQQCFAEAKRRVDAGSGRVR
ncbi:sugar phosphate isomerase/epimerase [Paludibaculum fermentans]|uniref:Sugar phosphate isomerase/epimerase n=1 Tax=Paludibaculum fermentans TaxID=1473598 RepID=A0A7S7NLL7_PALFE|nr:sugar phosphate isomerase/epimerase [Paludibaculum fermentans]QOY85815.1 sugar phosphate isomerase/epimerase [Paludibaculum fermentans]